MSSSSSPSGNRLLSPFVVAWSLLTYTGAFAAPFNRQRGNSDFSLPRESPYAYNLNFDRFPRQPRIKVAAARIRETSGPRNSLCSFPLRDSRRVGQAEIVLFREIEPADRDESPGM